MSGLKTQAGLLDGQDLYERNHRLAFACQQVAGLKVLELLCGEGDASASLRSVAAEVAGVDPDGEAIKRAQARHENIGALTYYTASLDRLPFADGTFDAVVSLSDLGQAGRKGALLDEARRVLKPKGFALVTLATGTGADAWQGALSKRFSSVAAYAQRIVAASSLAPLHAKRAAPNGADYRGYRTTLDGPNGSETGPGIVRLKDPTSVIWLASNAPLPHIDGPDSLFLMESIDLWARTQTRLRKSRANDLEGKLDDARTQISALVETRDSLERILAARAAGTPGESSHDLSVLGPVMEELAGKPVPADLPNLIKLLGQIGADSVKHEARVSEALREVATLTAAKRELVSNLEEIGGDAERQAILLREAAARSAEASALLAEQIKEQSELLTEVLQDLDRANEREIAAAHANRDLAIKAEDLQAEVARASEELRAQMARGAEALEAEVARASDELRAQMARGQAIEREFAVERQALSDQIILLEGSLTSANAAKRAADENLVEAVTARDVAEHQKAAAMAGLQDAISKEQDYQTEISRRAAVELHLQDALRKMTDDLVSSQEAASRQAADLLRLQEASTDADTRYRHLQQTLVQQNQTIATIEETARQAELKLREANGTVETLRTRLLEAAETELNLREEREVWTRELCAWEARQLTWDEERKGWEADQDLRRSAGEKLEAERKAWLSEQMTANAERDRLRIALETANAQRAAWEVELTALRSERQAWNQERTTYLAEREASQHERERWNAERSQLNKAAVEASLRADEYAEALKAARWWTRLGRPGDK